MSSHASLSRTRFNQKIHGYIKLVLLGRVFTRMVSRSCYFQSASILRKVRFTRNIVAQIHLYGTVASIARILCPLQNPKAGQRHFVALTAVPFCVKARDELERFLIADRRSEGPTATNRNQDERFRSNLTARYELDVVKPLVRVKPLILRLLSQPRDSVGPRTITRESKQSLDLAERAWHRVSHEITDSTCYFRFKSANSLFNFCINVSFICKRMLASAANPGCLNSSLC